MNLRKTISKEAIVLELKSTTKPAVLEELVDLLVAVARIPDRKAVLRAILDREKKMSTGMMNGVAVPHAKTDLVEGLVAVIGLKKEGLDFDSLDGQPVRIIVMTLSPLKRPGPHVQLLAEISRILEDENKRQRILNATTREEVLDLLTNGNEN